MLFSSWQFVFIFLPVSFLVYFFLNKKGLIKVGKLWLVIASLFFYSYWEIKYLPLIIVSIVFNYVVGSQLARWHGESALQGSGVQRENHRRCLLYFGLVSNILLLGYYKYTDFFVDNINLLWGAELPLRHIALPLAISFFTFTQIVYLVDSYRGETGKYDLLNYSLFVTFFPHLIAGPIVHHGQIMPQFSSRWTWVLRYPNILKGLFIFSVGLFKKVVIADSFAGWATAGFDGGQSLHFFAAWATSLSYTFQLYFDFSGYCDMAIGASLLFNIWLPINFNSPYKALDIQDFWRRWHITLSSFLRDYLYIPLGGNRRGEFRTYINLFITFVLGGLWHGATWMFVIWGALHGAALIANRLWKKLRCPMPRMLAWTATFMFVNVTWVFFRAKTLDDALRVLRGMVDFGSVLGNGVSTGLTLDLAWGGWLSDLLLTFLPASFIGQIPIYAAIIAGFFLVSQKNSLEMAHGVIDGKRCVFGVLLFVIAMYFSLASTSTVFLYFNF